MAPRVARRGDGYGFGKGDAHRLAALGCDVIVTGDCGTTDHETLALYVSPMGIEASSSSTIASPRATTASAGASEPTSTGLRVSVQGVSRSVGWPSASGGGAARTRRRQRAGLTCQICATFWTWWPSEPSRTWLRSPKKIAWVPPGLRELKRCSRPGLRALCEIVQSGLKKANTSADVAFRLAPRPKYAGTTRGCDGSVAPADYDGRSAKPHARRKLQRDERKRPARAGKEASSDLAARRRRTAPGTPRCWSLVRKAGIRGRRNRRSQAGRYLQPTGGGDCGLKIKIRPRLSAQCARSIQLSGLHGVSSLLLRYGGHAAAADQSVHMDNLDAVQESLCTAYRQQLGERLASDGCDGRCDGIAG